MLTSELAGHVQKPMDGEVWPTMQGAMVWATAVFA